MVRVVAAFEPKAAFYVAKKESYSAASLKHYCFDR